MDRFCVKCSALADKEIGFTVKAILIIAKLIRKMSEIEKNRQTFLTDRLSILVCILLNSLQK